MIFAKFWIDKVSANTPLKESDTVIKITSESFKKELEKAYNAGVEHTVQIYFNEKRKQQGFSYENKSVEFTQEENTSLMESVFGHGGVFDKIFGGGKYK
jgi:hypothetical protein